MRWSDLVQRSRARKAITVRLDDATRTALDRHLELRREHEGHQVTLAGVTRDLIKHALATVTETGSSSSENRDLVGDLMASILFTRKALELVLSAHDGLAHNLLRDARKEVALRRYKPTPAKEGNNDE